MSRRSVRTERRLFLADGPNAVAAALGRPGTVVEVFATPRAAGEHANLLAGAERVTPVDDRAMAALSDSVAPAGLVAVCRSLDRPLDHVLDPARPTPSLVAVCVDVRDPGNAGTVIRTADAAGAAAVVLAGESVDLHNPKTLRASAGSAFHVPVAIARDPVPLIEGLRGSGMTVLAADGEGELSLFDVGATVAGPVAWVFGNEAHGLDHGAAVAADHRVRIPLRGRAESLNLATAAALCLFETVRGA